MRRKQGRQRQQGPFCGHVHPYTVSDCSERLSERWAVAFACNARQQRKSQILRAASTLG